jgi:hypothetical protein
MLAHFIADEPINRDVTVQWKTWLDGRLWTLNQRVGGYISKGVRVRSPLRPSDCFRGKFSGGSSKPKRENLWLVHSVRIMCDSENYFCRNYSTHKKERLKTLNLRVGGLSLPLLICHYQTQCGRPEGRPICFRYGVPTEANYRGGTLATLAAQKTQVEERHL